MKNRKYLKYIFLLPVILLAMGVRSNAQSIVTGAISGTVTDASGAVVADANVTLVSEATQETRTAVTEPMASFNSRC